MDIGLFCYLSAYRQQPALTAKRYGSNGGVKTSVSSMARVRMSSGTL